MHISPTDEDLKDGLVCIWVMSDLAANLGNPCLIRLIWENSFGLDYINKLKTFLRQYYVFKKKHMNLAIKNDFCEVVEVFLEYTSFGEYTGGQEPFVSEKKI